VPARDPASKSPRTTLRVTIADDEVLRASSASISDRNVESMAAGLRRANTSGNLPRNVAVEGNVPLSDSVPVVARKTSSGSSSTKKQKIDKKKKKAVTRNTRSNSQPSKEGLDDILQPQVRQPSPLSPRTSRLKKARNRLSTEVLPVILARSEGSDPNIASELSAEKEQKKKKERSLFNRIRGKADSSKSSKVKTAVQHAQETAATAAARRSSQSPIVGYLRVSVLLTRINGKLRELERDGVGVNLKFGQDTLPDSLVMFSPFQQGLQPSQWLFPVSEKDLKGEELLVTVMNFVSRQTIGLITIPLKGVPFMHNSMTFGVMRSYPWVPVHKLTGSVRIGLKLTKKAVVTRVADRWTANCSGGDLDHNTWIRSPQYRLNISTESLVSFTLRTPVGKEHSVGFYVFQLKDDEASDVPKKLVDEDIESHLEGYHVWVQQSDVVDGETYLVQGTYVLLVCTSEPKLEGDYELYVSSAVCQDLELTRIDDCSDHGGEGGAETELGDTDDFGDFFDDGEDSGLGVLKLSVDKSSNGGGEEEDDDWDMDLDLPTTAPSEAKVGHEDEDEEDWDADWGDDDDDDDDDGAGRGAALPLDRAKESAVCLSAPASPTALVRAGKEDLVLSSQLETAIQEGDSKKLQTLLALAKNEPHSLGAALLASVRSGNTDLAKACIAHNADVNYKDENGVTPLLCAAEAGSYAIGKLLCDSGCECTAQDGRQESAVFKASTRGHLEFLRLPWEVKEFELERGVPPVQVDTPWEVCAIYHSAVEDVCDSGGCAGFVMRPQATLYVLEVFIKLAASGQQALLQLAIHNARVVQSVVCFDCGDAAGGRDASVNSHMLVTALAEISYRLAQEHHLPNGLSLQDAECACIFMLTGKEFRSLFDAGRDEEPAPGAILQCNLAGSLGEISSIRGFFDYVDTLCLVTADYRSGDASLRKSCTAIRGSFPQYRTAALVLSDAGYARLSVLLRGAKVPKETKGEFYFIIRVGESQHKTKLKRMKDMDSMSAKFTFAVDSPQDEVQVVLFTKTKAVNNLALGGVTMLVKDLPEDNVSNRDWHDLTAPGKKVVGQALLEFNYSRVQRNSRM